MVAPAVVSEMVTPCAEVYVPATGENVGAAVRGGERDGDELAVGGRVELDGQAFAFRVDAGIGALGPAGLLGAR